MRSTFGGLNTMVRGIFAQQASLDTVGHNISNANTEGYSRQSVNLNTTLPEVIYGNVGRLQIGTGVSIASITRARDTFVDAQMWKESSSLGYYQSKEDAMGRIEGVFKDTSDTGIQTVLNNFWNAWQTLSTNASDYGTRTALRQRGVELTDTIQHSAQQLKDIASDISSVISIKVDRVNQITKEILGLNKQISTIETGGKSQANDLRDRRDVLTDELSKLVKIQVHEDNAGNYLVQANGLTLVDATNVSELATVPDTSAVLLTDYDLPVNKIILKDSGQRITFSGGELQGLLDSRDDSTFGAKGYLDQLATMSKFLLRDFNDLHSAGVGLDGVGGRNFFGDLTGSYTAWDGMTSIKPGDWLKELQVNSAMFSTTPSPTAGLDVIAAKKATQGSASGEHAVLLAQALKSSVSSNPAILAVLTAIDPAYKTTLGNDSLDGYYNSLVGALGVQSDNAQNMAESQTVLVNQIVNWRESVSGVNMDEEMSNMIRFQKGYNAAARMMTTMDEMLDKLINGTGAVGR